MCVCACCEIRELWNKQCGVSMEGPQKLQRGVQMSFTQRSLPHQPSQPKAAVPPPTLSPTSFTFSL